jgi:hypothetical protein
MIRRAVSESPAVAREIVLFAAGIAIASLAGHETREPASVRAPLAVPVLIGMSFTGTAASCSDSTCPELVAPGAAVGDGLITAGLLAIDVLYWVAASRGFKLNNECKQARAR